MNAIDVSILLRVEICFFYTGDANYVDTEGYMWTSKEWAAYPEIHAFTVTLCEADALI